MTSELDTRRQLDTAAAESMATLTWRAAYELPAAWMWLIAGLYCLGAAMAYLSLFYGLLGLVSLAMSVMRFRSARFVLRARAALKGSPLQLINHKTLQAHLKEVDRANEKRAGKKIDGVWFGFGFDWTPEHAQKLYELSKIASDTLVPSKWIMHAAFLKDPVGKDIEAIGWAALDGLETNKVDVTVTEKTLEGGTLIVGTTQAGKGVLLTSLVTQAVWRGDTVIIIDPKNSSRLKNAVFEACKTVGRSKPYVFDPSEKSDVRLNPLANFSRTAELASRITATMNDNGPFTAFAWSAVHVVCELIHYCGRQPTIAAVESTLAHGLQDLLLEAMKIDKGETAVEMMQQDIETRGLKGRDAMLALCKAWHEGGGDEEVIAMGIAVFSHDPVHYSKITASLMPTLAMLTSGALRDSLSPDTEGYDRRPALSLGQVLDQNQVLYVCLNSLPDPVVASAIGSIMLADLAGCAGARYNNPDANRHRVSLFVDECSNVMNRSLIELLNKGAESGIRTTCAMQTVSDLAARLGNVNEARMALGNFNTLVSLRTKDRVTQEFVAETFGRTYIANTSATISSNSDPDNPGRFTASYARQLAGSREEIIPQDVLGKLPNCEYFASLAGGRIVKGRIPILAS
ncbi:MAG: conjugative transfer system coupling protein TraD [Sutterellaceae bacterium]|nr:conjugative transfer system coupling protein TraD [Sutterellaceae bacterium]